MRQMQGLDASFVALESARTPAHIGSTMIYDPSTAPGGFVRYRDIMNFIKSRLQLAPMMRRKMAKVPFGIDYPYWVNDINFDMEFHVRHLALPKPGDWRQLCIQSARIFARPLDLTRPPWELTIIEGLDNVEGVPKGSYAIVTKMHHSAVDGASGVDMMEALHTITPDIEAPQNVDEWRPESDPSQVGLFTRGMTRSIMSPIEQARALSKSLPGLYRAAQGFLNKEYDVNAIINAPRTRFNGMVSPHRVFDAVLMDGKEITRIRKLADGAKMNDVMLSIVGGAMRKYLESKNELPEESLTAMAPISVREAKEKNTMGNQVSGMFVPLGSHIKNVTERMEYVNSETKRAKAMTHALGARQTSEMAKLSSAPMMNIGAYLYRNLKIADRMKPMFNTVVTNVPGPPVPLYSAGARVVASHGMLCLIDGLKMGHIVSSYAGDVSLSFTACREAIPDPDFYTECIRESYQEHVKAINEMEKKHPNLAAEKTSNAKKAQAKKAPTQKSAKKAPAKKPAAKTMAKKASANSATPEQPAAS